MLHSVAFTGLRLVSGRLADKFPAGRAVLNFMVETDPCWLGGPQERSPLQALIVCTALAPSFEVGFAKPLTAWREPSEGPLGFHALLTGWTLLAYGNGTIMRLGGRLVMLA